MSADGRRKRYQRAHQFYKGGICRDCGQPKEDHELTPFVGAVSMYQRYACPDLTIPDPRRDDDPWDQPDRVNPGEALFDPYD